MEDNSPLVSIGVPVYNGEEFLRKSLDSLLAQTYQNIEIIISDNASTDRTAEICKEYEQKDHRIRYYRNDINIGVVKNFRRVFQLSSGEYFMWNGADDIRPPSAVEDCLSGFARNNKAVMAHGPILINIKGQKELIRVPNQMDLTHSSAATRVRAFVLGLRHIAMEYGLYRRSALAKGIYGNHYGQDFLICLQMSLLGPIEYVAAPMMIFYEGAPLLNIDPIAGTLHVTLPNLLHPSRNAKKAWIMLSMGVAYLLRISGVNFRDRLNGTIGYMTSFARRYRKRLGQEAVFLIFLPAAWLRMASYKAAKPIFGR
jgi:glycosyltransferase involved in cell wall biosynthesis